MKKILFILLFALTGTAAHAQLLGVKSNLLMDVATVPDLGLEIATSERTSVAINGFKSWKIYGTPANIYGFTPEFRYWINGRPFDRFYAGAGLSLAHYDIEGHKGLIKLKHDYVGSSYGGGIDFGYVLYMAPHFAMDFHAGLGIYRYQYERDDESQDGPDVISYSESKSKGWSLLPYQLGVSLVYIIK